MRASPWAWTSSAWRVIGALGALTLGAGELAAAPLRGDVQDALTGVPIPGATVRVLGTSVQTQTDDRGQWVVDLPEGVYELELEVDHGGERHRSRLVNQHVPQIKPASMHLYSARQLIEGHPMLAEPHGLPGKSGQAPHDAPPSLPIVADVVDAVDAPTQIGSPLRLTVPDPIPRRIRVGRRERPKEGCSNNPVVAIEEMDLDEYVKGVLPPEIGVFRSLPGAAEVYKTFAIAAKSYGLYFMLFYGPNNRRTTGALPPNNFTWFHIDDTACNQRYSDERLTLTTQSADAVANVIMVKKGDPRELDKLEYAASCGKHGTLPEYGSINALIPDDPPVSSCVGRWCGHNTCAGHQDNPHVAGTDRCLVRGVCQWGSASWGEAGKDYRWMIAHYQPNMELRDLSQSLNAPMTVKLTGYAYTDPSDILGTAVPGVEITLNDGQKTSTNGEGLYEVAAVDTALGTVTIRATKEGYQEATRQKALIPGEANWASIRLLAEGAQPTEDMALPEEPDMPPSLDMAPREPDQGPEQPRPVAGDERPGRLDSLINESPGIEGGCGAGCAQANPGATRAGWGLLSLGALLALRRRRKR